MKRERVDLADVACRDNLALACWKAAQGKRQRPMLNVAEARFERALVNSSFACRPGKGVHAAVAAVQRGLQRWPWVVQVDVAGYFGSIQHRLLMQQLGRLFKDDAPS
ncbi:MAG: hypothetical protein U5L74_00305 [Ideonella sp.]|nr:hypothetical protein [Ideonella sp.]